MSAEKAPPSDHREMRDLVGQSRDNAMESAFGIHDAALVLEIIVAFEQWAAAHARLSLDVNEVVGFLLTYGHALAGEKAQRLLKGSGLDVPEVPQ